MMLVVVVVVAFVLTCTPALAIISQGLVLNGTCDNRMNLYLDGVKKSTPNKDNWTKVDTLIIPENTSSLGIHCTNIGGAAGIIASLSDGRVTNIEDWKCVNNEQSGWTTESFDDSSWPNAVSFGTIGVDPWSQVKNIASGAEWIWTAHGGTIHNPVDLNVYCRISIKIHGGWAAWGQWSGCPTGVASGTQTRTRTCTNPTPNHNGNDCSGSSSESRTCTNGVWSNWSSWTTCSKSCATGSQSSTRTCTPPTNGGADCSGSSTQTQSCNTGGCPYYGTWESYGDCVCPANTYDGIKTRNRTCIDPAPSQNNGADCVGDSSSTANCNCPRDGVWGGWSQWSACPTAVAVGTQQRTRECDNPSPAYNGLDCSGDGNETRTCINPCHESIYEVINEDYKRSAGYTRLDGEENKSDRYIDAGWYRFTGPQGEDMVTSSPGLNKCGTTFPIWLSEPIGPGPEDSFDFKACVAGFDTDCAHSYTVSLKMCDSFNVYYLKPTDAVDEVYCVGTEVPCPANTYSPNGYTPGCQADVDECATNNGGCDQICTNIVGFTGSYACSCNNGYTLNADGHKCDDINECLNDNGGCIEMCTNNDGGFECSCNFGRQLSKDRLTCIDPCDASQYTLIQEDYKRSAGYDTINGETKSDRYIDAGWYRYTGPQGQDMVTSSPGLNKCGTVFPIWLNGVIPSIQEGIVDRRVCVVGFTASCDHQYNIQVKNCGSYRVYHHTPTDGVDEVYCIGTEVPCPANTYSPNDYTPGCTADVDECSTNNGGCDQICTNIVGFTGSYECSCNNGYTLNADGHKCDDINECLIDNGGCIEICTNNDGGFECSCNFGRQLSKDGLTCIDPCDANQYTLIHEDYKRSAGYDTINGETKSDRYIDAGWYRYTGPQGQDMVTSSPGLNKCGTVFPIWLNGVIPSIQEGIVDRTVCVVGFTASCDHQYSIQVKNCGSYRVYHHTPTDGVDEVYCIGTEVPCPSDEYSVNGYTPGCQPDVDECATDNGGCDQICTNIAGFVGTYECSCNNGYTLNADGHTCDDINECATNNGGCEVSCVNTIGSYRCKCDVGYQLNADGYTCSDIDECSTTNGGCNHVCTNTLGSYTCSCNTGYELTADGHTCQDINECDTNNGECDDSCVNTPGSYHCTCDNGYELHTDGHTCTDIDECSTNNGGCDHSCTNTDGSYQCGCNDGYELNVDGHACDDINECNTGNDDCDHICTNTDGSYECSCNDGYQLKANGHACEDINECNTGNGDCDHSCTNTDGSYECDCNDGYRLNADGHACDDINECDNSNGGCSDICNNTIGSFACHCQIGSRFLADGKTCIVEKPIFTGPTITWSIRQDGIIRSVVLECTIEHLEKDLLFEYKWYIGSTLVWEESSPFETSKLLETEWTPNENIQQDAKCEVFARRYAGWEAASAFTTYFVGFTVDNDVLYAEEGGDPVYYVVRPTVPVLCPQGFDDCTLPLEVHTPVSKEDTNIPATCAKDGQMLQQGALEFLQTPCRVDIGMTTVITPNTSFAIAVSAAVDNVYDGEHVMSLFVAGPERHQYHELMENIVLPEAKVIISDKDVEIAGAVCKARNDPHMTTFDGRNYENQLEGEFILYKHHKFPIEVRAYFRQCNKYATCVCGVAVRSGGDLFIYDSCKKFYKQPQRVRMYECEDDTINVVAVTRKRYRITLPTGTVVTADRGWIQIVPSMTDFKSVEGLCGTLDGNCGNEFKLRDGSFSTVNTASSSTCDSKSGSKRWFHPNDFSKSWRVDASDSWYQGKIPDPHTIDKVIYCSCPKGGTDAVCNTSPKGSASIQNCVEIDENSPRSRCLLRKKRSTSGDDVEEEVGAFGYDPNFVAETADWRNGWNETAAEEYCRDDIEGRAALQGDQVAEIADIEGAIDTCVEDIRLSGGTTYTQVHVDDTVEDVTREISKNMSFFSMDASGNVVLPALLSQLCPSDCSNHGICIDGTCDCDEHYGGTDCSTELDTIPTLYDIQSGGLCDVQVRPCQATPVQGEYFVQSDSLTCQITPILLENGKEVPQASVSTKAEYDHTNRLLCPLPNMADGLNDDVTAYTFSVAVANDAKNFSEPKSVTVYDSKCIECTTSSTVQCDIKPNTCYIHQICYDFGEIDPLDECNICDPFSSFNSWSLAKAKGCKSPNNTLMIAGVVSAVVIVCTIAVVVAIIYAIKKTTVTKVTDISLAGNGFSKEAYA